MDLIRIARNFLHNRQRAYKVTFDSDLGKEVLKDLHKFCRASKPTYSSDPREHAMLEGRREVWLRIAHHLNLTDEQLWALYDGRK